MQNPTHPGDRNAPAGTRKKTWVNVLAVLALAGFVVVTVVYNRSIKTKAKEGRPAPDLQVEDMSGRPVALKDFLGGPVLINLWTTWCVSCKEETPALQAFHERYGDKMKIIGVDVREPVDTIKEYLDFYSVTYLILRDRNGNATSRYNVRGYPESWFVDKDGIARKYWEGPMTFEQMQGFYSLTTGQSIDAARVGAVPAGGHLHTVGLRAGGGAPVFYAGTHDGLFSSTDGREWQAVSREMNLDREDAMGLAVPAAAPGTFFAAGHNVGVLRSQDGGRTWQDVSGGLPARDVHALSAGPAGRDVYAWVENGGLYRSVDGGASWQAVPGLNPALPVTALAVDPRDPNRVLLAAAQEGPIGWEGRLLESGDGGRNWAEMEVGEQIRGINFAPAVFGIAFDPSNPRVVYFATSKGIWRSEDGGRGARWLRKSHMRRMAGVAAAPGSRGGTTLLAGAPNGDLYLSEDGGAAWRLLTR